VGKGEGANPSSCRGKGEGAAPLMVGGMVRDATLLMVGGRGGGNPSPLLVVGRVRVWPLLWWGEG